MLVPLDPQRFDIRLAYATADNVTGRPVYRRALALLHPAALACLERAADLAARQGLRLGIFDAFRPTEAQWLLWNAATDKSFFSDPRRGSPHSRGVAVDLTLVDRDGEALDMGTGFDALTPLSHHGASEIGPTAERNRMLLLGIMSVAGWDFFSKEWWHYQLFDARRFPLWSDSALSPGLM